MSKPKTFRPWTPEQTLLLPPSPVEWLPANHLVFFLLDLAAELNLSAIYAVYEARVFHDNLVERRPTSLAPDTLVVKMDGMERQLTWTPKTGPG
jgi:hypothetical protein